MPNGHIHREDTLAVARVSFLLGSLFIGIDAGTDLAVGALLAVFLNPDLDVDAGSEIFNSTRFIFGGWLSVLWRVYWYPYAKLLPHRSIWSHGVIIGTVIRLMYLLSPWLIIHFLVTGSLPAFTNRLPYYFIGLSLADVVHTIHDFTSGGHHER